MNLQLNVQVQQVVWDATKNIVAIPVSNILAMVVKSSTANVITVNRMTNQ